MTRRIRPLAIRVFHHGGRILVSESQDPIERGAFFRPLGGGIEFGEPSARAVERELCEDIGAVVARLRPLGTLENAFAHLGEPGHDIVQLYDGAFVDAPLCERASIPGRESDGEHFAAVGRDLDGFSTAKRLVPHPPRSRPPAPPPAPPAPS